MRNLIYKLGVLLAFTITGLSMAYMNMDVKCPPVPPEGYHKNTTILGLELTNNPLSWYASLSATCPIEGHVADLKRTTERDFLFIVCYSFFFFMVLLVAFRDKPIRFWIGIVMVILAALFDILENRSILNALAHLKESKDTYEETAYQLGWMYKFAFSKWVIIVLLINLLFVGVFLRWNRLKTIVATLNLLLLLLFIIIPNHDWFRALKTSEWVLGYFLLLLFATSGTVLWRKRAMA